MRSVLLILILISIAGASAVSAETLAAPRTTFVAIVASQARVNVDAQGSILSVFNTTDGSSNKPAILNVYHGDVNIPMTPAIQANLETISPLLDWSQGGLIYPRPVILAPPTLPLLPLGGSIPLRLTSPRPK
jgi:hypothetical protein